MGIKYDWTTGNYAYSGLTLSEEELHSFRKSNAERMYNLIIEGRADVCETLDEDEYKNVTALFCPVRPEKNEADGIIPSAVTQTFNMGLNLALSTLQELLK